jgi:lambda repressor-like predicted transcriptional regulator
MFALQSRGFSIRQLFERDGQFLSTIRTTHRAAPRILVDFLICSSGIEPDIVRDARPARCADIVCKVAQPWHLIAMKVLAGRPKDLPDLHDLIRGTAAGDRRRARSALKKMMKNNAAPGRDLLAEFELHLESLQHVSRDQPMSAATLRRLLPKATPRK